MTRRDRDDVLTIGDVDDLPNGLATVVRATSPDGQRSVLASFNGDGYLHTLDGSRRYIPAEWHVDASNETTGEMELPGDDGDDDDDVWGDLEDAEPVEPSDDDVAEGWP